MDMKTRYMAAMVLSGVGDALGFKNGSWEFCYSGKLIHKEAKQLGGVENIEVSLPGWRVSDDTVMHLALAQALATSTAGEDKDVLYSRIAQYFKRSMDDMYGRSPGPTTMNGCRMLKPEVQNGYCIPFNPRGGGCGGAMRSMCIGLRYPRPEEIDDLVAVSIEAGRMTHHHPTGYLGSLASALFTSYAIQGKPLKLWGWTLVNEVLPKAKEYIKARKEFVEKNIDSWDYFQNKWAHYLDIRCLSNGNSEPYFPNNYGVKERDAFYKSLSFDGWGGASGHDAPMIAYDALLSSNGDWKELCSRAMFHSGDSDSTGVIAACCYGAMNGFQGVPECNYQHLEYCTELKEAADAIYTLSHPDDISAKSHESERNERTERKVDKPFKFPLKEISEAPEGNVAEENDAKSHSDEIKADSLQSEKNGITGHLEDGKPEDPPNENHDEPVGDEGEKINNQDYRDNTGAESLQSETNEKTENMDDEKPEDPPNENRDEPVGDEGEKINNQDYRDNTGAESLQSETNEKTENMVDEMPKDPPNKDIKESSETTGVKGETKMMETDL